MRARRWGFVPWLYGRWICHLNRRYARNSYSVNLDQDSE